MRTYAIASDYDGTLATSGRVSPETLRALERFRAAGHRLLMVTGREINDLKSIFPGYGVFELIVAENGALLYDSASDERTRLAPSPSAAFIAELRRRGVQPLYLGEIIIGTFAEHGPTIQAVIDDLHAASQLILNKESVMVLPNGVDKAFGLHAALKKMKIDVAGTIGVGDAENDTALLEASGYAVAVANALPSLKEIADWVTPSAAGAGVVELIEKVLTNSLSESNALR